MEWWKRRKRIKCRLAKTLEVDVACNWMGTEQASLQIHYSRKEIFCSKHFGHMGNALQQKVVELGWLKISVVGHSTSQIVPLSHLRKFSSKHMSVLDQLRNEIVFRPLQPSCC